MANKIDVKLILELLQTPMSQREIIKTRHISSKSITAVCRRAAELGVSYADLADKTKLACALNMQGWKKKGEVPNIFWEESAKLYEEILAHDQSCIIPLISIYSMLGKREKAEQKASEQPDLELCRQVLLGNLGSIGSINDDKRAEQYRGDAVLELLHAFQKSLDEAIVCNAELNNSREAVRQKESPS